MRDHDSDFVVDRRAACLCKRPGNCVKGRERSWHTVTRASLSQSAIVCILGDRLLMCELVYRYSFLNLRNSFE